MNKTVLYGLGAAAVVVIAIILGSQLLDGSGTGTDAPSVEPTVTAEPSEDAAAPPLTQSFTSTQHGISLAYPEGWNVQAATEPWTQSTFPLEFGQPHADWLSDPTLEANLFLTLASQPIGDLSPEEWTAEQLASEEGCAASEAITVDGAAGLIGADGCNVAVVTNGDRGYWIQLYTSGDDPDAVAAYDRAWFEEVLATVQLPASAASPTRSFTSTQHGVSLSYPEGWNVDAATDPWTESTFPLEFGQPHADWLSDPVLGSDLFLTIASQQISDLPLRDWVVAQMASGEGCTATEAVTIDGATGLIGADGCHVAVVALSSRSAGQAAEGNAGRGYWIQLYTGGDDPDAVAGYDSAWFEEVLATVQLNPEAALD